MDAMTLREVCDILEISRRTIQGYEKAGLVSPSGRNKRGYLLYDEKTRERIKEIRLFQMGGLSRKEIAEMIDASGDVRKEALERLLIRLEEKKEDVDLLIQEIYQLIERS